MKLEAEDNGKGGRRTSSIKWIPIEKNPKVWADITNVNGRESFNNNQLQAEITHRIIIRYRKDVTRTNRIRYAGREFRIEYIVDRNEQRRFLQLHCVEEV